MKTAEEMFDEFLNKNGGSSLGSPINAAYEGFLAGYKEAMRWRNPKKESPPVGAYVQLKTFDTFHNRQVYTHDEYLGNNKWRFWESEYLGIIGWRPIE